MMAQRGSSPGRWPQPPVGGRPLIGRRKAGERIGLLIVSVHDEAAGRELALRSGTAHIQVRVDMLPHELDWSCAVALDCVILGTCSQALFYATATMLYAAGAASIWGEFDDGIWRLERWHSASCPTGFYADDGPVPLSRLGEALAFHRSWALMRRAGVYGTELFDAARDAEFSKIFGPLAEKAQAWLGQKLGNDMARAA
jgi:hypothetical protein